MQKKNLILLIAGFLMLCAVSCGNINKQNVETETVKKNEFHDERVIYITTSDDQKLNVYNVDLNKGADRSLMYLYSYNDSNSHLVAGEFIPDKLKYSEFSVESIYTIEANNQNYYLMVFSAINIHQGISLSKIIRVYQVKDGELQQEKGVFVTPKQNLNELEVSANDNAGKYRYNEDSLKILYNHDSKTLYIPLVTSIITEKNQFYQWKNNHFEYVGIK